MCLIRLLIVLFAICTAANAGAGEPTDQLREGVDRVVRLLRDPELKGDKKADERRSAIGKIADEIFDFAEMTKRALGSHWVERTPAE
jgi:phospholipid transport system substrate-binding protein